ncbi:MAG: glycosyl hydrolase [Acidobacteriia bacterium]|nr:glycosyl hydrolase [Terriglobia bacterium]
MIQLNSAPTLENLVPRLERAFELSAAKIHSLAQSWEPSQAVPVITVQGRYTSRAWTEWTQGFQFGSALLQYDATGEKWFLDYGRENTRKVMAPHLTHFGVHDHGFNNVSTYGNLWRLGKEGKIAAGEFEKDYYELALKVSGAVQAARWSSLRDGRGFIHSFNGPHSLFVDTLRSLRSLAIAHRLGHVLWGESDQRISLLERLVHHAAVTAEYAVFYGEGRDQYDVPGRVAQESIFNMNDGTYRCPSTQQGYSPYTTWTRGLAWIMLGFAEQLEFLASVPDHELAPLGGRTEIEGWMLRATRATCEYYLQHTPSDGIPYWDTGAPNLTLLGDYLNRASDPYNEQEPVDSSAATVAAQALWRFGAYLLPRSPEEGQRYRRAALVIAAALFDWPYLSDSPSHQGLILHSLYHRPQGWDYVPPGHRIPCEESSMWGDYHARELALLLLRQARGEAYLTFF